MTAPTKAQRGLLEAASRGEIVTYATLTQERVSVRGRQISIRWSLVRMVDGVVLGTVTRERVRVLQSRGWIDDLYHLTTAGRDALEAP